MAKLVIYHDRNFGGPSREITEDVLDLTSIGFADRTSSIKVVGSVWVGYEHPSYGGRQYILEEGAYSNSNDWAGKDNQLSSFKKLEPAIGEMPQISLFEHSNYDGQAVTFTYAINNLLYYKIDNMISSIRVKSGIWILYEYGEFGGIQHILSEGSYPTWNSWKGADNQISALRPVKEPYFPTEVLSMEYDIAAGLLSTTPLSLVNLTQNNASHSVQAAEWNTKRSVTTTKTYEWHWDNETAVSVETEFTTGVPCIAEGKIKAGLTNTFSIGENRGSENTQSEEWGFSLPGTVEPMTHLRVQVNIQQGKIDVPFTAILKKGNRRWKEIGTYKGTQSYNAHVDYKGTPLVDMPEEM